jgi:cell division protease FtsH
MTKKKINFDIFVKDETTNGFSSMVDFIFNNIIFISVCIFILSVSSSILDMKQMSSPISFLTGITSNSYDLIDRSGINTTFGDVAGCDEAKYELIEVVDFLKNPIRYTDAGAKTPKGILLAGNPGTGKTMLARAVANEANVSFISTSGSEFIELFAGMGASRVRSLFNNARNNAPCVIFIDEIDAIGRQRGTNIGGVNDEREQTLNEILTNMDGFKVNSGVIVIAATNRFDILDSALIRPGRFDRKILVPLPDFDGRKQIASIHFRNKNVNSDVDYDELSSLTGGFSGADIANLANEAAIYSVRLNKTSLDRESILQAYEKITIGLNSNMQENDENVIDLVSYHEAGHALMASIFKDFFDVRKVTINANKGGAGGYTLFTPKELFQKYATKKYMLSNLIVSMGGRAAEVYHFRKSKSINKLDSDIFRDFEDLDVTTGASNDLMQANKISRDYLTKYGFGDDLNYYDDDGVSSPSKISEELKYDLDKQVRELVNFAFKTALKLIYTYEESMEEIVMELKKKRIISGSDIQKILINNTTNTTGDFYH